MKNRMIATESFRSGNDQYFFDYMEAVNGRHYLRIARMENKSGQDTLRSKVVVFEDVIQPMISAFAYLLHAVPYCTGKEIDPKEIREQLQESRTVRENVGSDMPVRERLVLLGTKALSDTELLGVLFGFGATAADGEMQAAELMDQIGSRLEQLPEMGQADFCRMPGIGMGKSCLLLAAIELGRRCFAALPISMRD